MKTRTTRFPRFAKAPWLAASVSLTALAAQPAYAQDRDEQSASGEAIVVTGSRIARQIDDGLFPTTTVDDEFIDSRGYYNAGEAIISLPLFSNRSNSDTDFNQAAVDVGLTFADLFGLGAERTLTLINGRRVVASSSPQPNRSTGQSGLQVDLNTIPTALIDRVEIITIGGAPVYGADAIAGTVNIILKDHFDGLEVDLQSGISEEGDAANYRLRAVYGRNFLGDRANIVLSAEYSRREGLAQTARPGANDAQVSNILLATNPGGFFSTVPQPPLNTFQRNTALPGLSAFGSPISPNVGIGGVLGNNPIGFAENAQGQVLMFNAQGELIPVPLGNGNGTILLTQNQPDFPGLFRLQDSNSLLNQSERYILSSLGHLNITDNIRAIYQINYSHLDASQPTDVPTILLPGIPVSINNPFLSPTARATLQAATTDVFGFANPPFLVGGNFILGKSLTEFGGRGIRAEAENWSAVVGLEGDFSLGGRAFNWDVTYSYGRNEAQNIGDGVLAAPFALARDAVLVNAAGTIITDPTQFAPFSSFTFNAAAGGYTGPNGQRIICRARATGAAGGANCLPFNPFGAQNPPEVIAALSAQSVFDTEIRQQFVQANLSGSPFDLPAGPAQFAFGVEHRRERSEFTPDALTAAGAFISTLPGSAVVAGGFNSSEAYVEAIIPLLSGDMIGMPYLRRLAFEGAARYIDNSRAGGDWVWTAGGRLETPDFVIRGNKTRSVRSPGIGQLFSGQAPVFTSVADPCSNANFNAGPSPADRRANCIAAAIAAGRATNEATAVTFLQSFVGSVVGIPGIIGGNPNLENEVADSWTIGAVVRPRFIPGLSFSVDWNDINLRGAIQSLGGSQVVAACFDSANFPNAPSCSQFTRNPTNFNIASFQAGFINIGFIDFAALTANLHYRLPLGRDSLTFSGNLIVLDHYRTSTDGVVVTEQRDTFGTEKFRAQAAIAYTHGGFTVQWNTNFVPRAFITPEERDGTSNLFEFDRTDDSWIHDLSILYAVNENFRIRFIVNNITEELQAPELRQFAALQARIGRTYVFGVNFGF